MNSFRRSGAAEVFYHFFLFAFTLGCGWLASTLLDAAMESDISTALRTSACLSAVLAVGLPVIYFWRKALGRMVRDDRQDFREKLYEVVIDRRLTVENTGELEVRLTRDGDTVAEFYQSSLPAAIESGGIILGATVLLCRAHLGLGLLLFGMSLLQLVPTVTYEKWAKEIYEQTSDAEEDLDSWFVQGYNGLSTLKSYRQEDWFLDKVEKNTDSMIRAGFRAEQTVSIQSVILDFVDRILRYGSYIIMGLFVLFGWLEVSQTPVLIVLSSYLFGSVGTLLSAFKKCAEYQAAKKHLAEIDLPVPEKTKQAMIRASCVSKRYGEKAVLEDVSLSVQSGERVLICGKNGSGKSTLLRIMLGLLPADAGEVAVGTDRIAFALQEEANLTLTGEELSGDLLKETAVNETQLREYLYGFEITDELMKRPLSDWSMGERKKFYLAAAFARGGEVLALDEPTNHLDGAAKKYLNGLIAAYSGTVLAVSHREDLPVEWDQVITLKGGEAE